MDEKIVFFENLKKMELRGTGETGTNILSPDVAVLPEAEGLLL
jgi:hypothetical protein